MTTIQYGYLYGRMNIGITWVSRRTNCSAADDSITWRAATRNRFRGMGRRICPQAVLCFYASHKNYQSVSNVGLLALFAKYV